MLFFSPKQTILIISAIFITIIKTISSICVDGGNCPFNHGSCVNDKCVCNDYYWTLFDKNLPLDSQTYCNYERINHFILCILEFFLPSIGHFYAGKYIFGALKLLIVIIFVIFSIIVKNEIILPPFLIKIAKFFGMNAQVLIPGLPKLEEDDKKNEETPNNVNISINIQNTNDNNNKEKKREDKYIRGKRRVTKNEADENGNQNITKPEDIDYMKEKMVKEETVEEPENLEAPPEHLINNNKDNYKTNDFEQKENETTEQKEEEINKSLSYRISQVTFNVTGFLLSLVWAVDVICYLLKFYKDGNGVPLV